MVSPAFGSGFLTYNTNILKGILNENDGNIYYIFINRNVFNYFSIPKADNIQVILISNFFSRMIPRYLWMQIILPFQILSKKIEYFFSPMNIMPILLVFSNVKTTLVIHSNLPWLYPEDVPGGRMKFLFQKLFTNLSIIISEKIIVDSKTAKKELIKLFPKIINKIEMVYLGLDIKNFSIKNNQSLDFDNRINIMEEKYFLTIASAVSYHCLKELIEGFDKFLNQTKSNIKLLLISKNLNNIYFNEIVELLSELKNKDKIILLEDIDREMIPKLYTNAELYIFPSYCEVFGFTNLEAMSCGTPVLTSKLSAMPEICGEAAIYFDPKDPNDIKEKIIYTYFDKKVKSNLINKGFIQAKKYTWDKTCSRTKSIILNS
jgi:glycosyltransferase involved in cell wall biosynthesis